MTMTTKRWKEMEVERRRRRIMRQKDEEKKWDRGKMGWTDKSVEELEAEIKKEFWFNFWDQFWKYFFYAAVVMFVFWLVTLF